MKTNKRHIGGNKKKINLKSYLAPSTKLFYYQQKVIQNAKSKSNKEQNKTITNVIQEYLVNNNSNPNTQEKPKLNIVIDEQQKSSSLKDPLWVRLKNAQIASYSLIEERAVADTKKALAAFQKNRFHGGDDDNNSNYNNSNNNSRHTFDENKVDFSNTPPKSQCHPSSILDEIHGYWQDQENVTLLRRLTGFSVTEIRRLFLNFKSLCSMSETPYGITYHTFCNAIPTFTFEDPLFSNRVFEFFDTCERGLWRWEEYLLCMALLFKTCRVLQTFFIFKLYDVNNDGTISKDEMCHFFIKSLTVEVDAHLLELCETHINALFKRIDEDDDGEISLEETLLYVENHPEIEDIYGVFGRTIVLPNLKCDKDQENIDDDSGGKEKDDENQETEYEKWKRINEMEEVAPTHSERDLKLFKAIKQGKIDLNTLWEQLKQSICVGTNRYARERIDEELNGKKIKRGERNNLITH